MVALFVGLVGGYLFGASGATQIVRPSAPEASAGPPVQLELGQTGTTSTGSHVTVLSWDRAQPEDWPPPPAGYEYSEAVVRFCAGPGVWNFRIREIPYLFNLVNASPAKEPPLFDPFVDVRYGLKEFASYNTGLISPDECIVGTVIFQTRTYERVSAVRFTGHGSFEWDVRGISDRTSPAPTPSYSPGIEGSASSPS